MPEPIYIPQLVRDDIAKHVDSAVTEACEDYLSAEEDEDTLTGHLGALLRAKSKVVHVLQDELPGDWRWSINYFKFRGRGANATESVLGADGIFELTVDYRFRRATKSLLFQSKKKWSTDAQLFGQCVKLSTWREASIVVNYTPEVYQAYSIDDVIRSGGKRTAAPRSRKLSDVLGKAFPDCSIGDTELLYDAKTKMLIWRALSNELVSTRFKVGHRIAIDITAPRRDGTPKAGKVIPNDQVHTYRMKASNEEMLSLPAQFSNQQLKAARKNAALAYHPDRFGDLSSDLQSILNRRAQEMNNACDEVAKKEAGKNAK